MGHSSLCMVQYDHRGNLNMVQCIRYTWCNILIHGAISTRCNAYMVKFINGAIVYGAKYIIKIQYNLCNIRNKFMVKNVL